MYIVWIYFDHKFYTISTVYSTWEKANQFLTELESRNVHYTGEIRGQYYLDLDLFPIGATK